MCKLEELGKFLEYSSNMLAFKNSKNNKIIFEPTGNFQYVTGIFQIN